MTITELISPDVPDPGAFPGEAHRFAALPDALLCAQHILLSSRQPVGQ
jgi:hypothetical protein